MLTYQQAKAAVASARDLAAGKPIANHTRVIARGANFAVRFHETDIVTIHKNGAYTLNSGGWRSMTTAARINEYAPGWLHSDRGIWRYAGDAVFRDGCKIDSDGRAINAGTPASEKRERKLREQVKAYAAEYIRKLYAGELDPPSGGDCWGCSMVNADKESKDQYPMGHSCVRGHVREKYYVPSLIVRVLKTRGCGPMHFSNLNVLFRVPRADTGFALESFRKDYTRALRRFCLQQCGLAY